MPIYEYRCKRGHTFDAIQRMSDEPLEVCEVCEAPATRVLHAPAVHFKGSGFYNTDYGTRKRAREKSAAEGSGSDSSGAGKDGGGEKPKSSSSSSEGSGAKPSEKSAPAGAKP
jgi:putative FmdB family regulatory protein